MQLNGLDKFTLQGATLLEEQNSIKAHADFNQWVSEVSQWLTINYKDTGLSADWAAQGNSPLIKGSRASNLGSNWSLFTLIVQQRLRWLSSLPSRVGLMQLTMPAKLQNDALEIGRKEIKLQTISRAYVDPQRINELKNVKFEQYDLSKLIRLCEELNLCFAVECYFAVAMLTRSIMDHIPPIFGYKTFAEVANNYGTGGKSFKDLMLELEKSSRNISDYHLHTRIRSSEVLPNVTQINFSNNLDFLLSEIVRISKNAKAVA
jgi:hypothetical protein